jgi:hypothetical protein
VDDRGTGVPVPALGPSGWPAPDHLGMAGARARVESGQHMAEPHQSAPQSRLPDHPRRGVGVHLLALVLALLALVATTVLMGLVAHADAADGPRKVVVVAGPVHSLTDRFRGYAAAIADAAEQQGMAVTRIFHPYAPPSRVKKLAQGADLFVYVGHGNGWPSDFGDFQEDTKDGLGLDVQDPDLRSDSAVEYKGANWLRENIKLAPNAVVILSHLSYASGNASSGMPIPTRDVAVQRVDNFANGFLSIGARVVWALGWQPGADIVTALSTEDATMDQVFMTRYRDGVSPLNGWIGQTDGYYDSVRIPGARVHIDPDSQYGYLRGVTGDLAFTTTEWRGGAASEVLPPDTTPPELTDVVARQAAVTISSVTSSVPVFTPNGDGLSDTVGISYRLSESATLAVRVKRAGHGYRHWSSWAFQGPGTIVWDGRRDDGAYADEGQYNIYLTPTDAAGNVGQTVVVKVRLLNSLRNPTARPALFWNRDGDELAVSTQLRARITREATVSLIIRDASGKVVRKAVDSSPVGAGLLRSSWDGTDDSGALVPDGRYRARFRIVRPAGAYAHEIVVRHMPFQAWAPRWSVARGGVVTLRLTSAEPLKGKPRVFANQPGIRRYELPRRMVQRISSTRFVVRFRTRQAGGAGAMKVRVLGTDIDGGTNTKIFTLRLR